MSYRELRNFSIYLRFLGYPHPITQDQFQHPDFPSISKLLHWLLDRLDSNSDLHYDVETSQDRVEFLQSAAQIAWHAAEIRLNLRNLYKADRYAVKELLKIAHVLYKAVQLTKEPMCADLGLMRSGDLEVLRSSRHLGTKLVTNGARLHEVLGEETKHHPAREEVIQFLDELAYNIESNEPQKKIETKVQEQLESCSRDAERLKLQIQSCQVDEKNLQKKLSRKNQEFERANKQLQNLKAMEHAKKLPFMAEKQELEEELREITSIYIETYRNLSWLDSEVAGYREKQLVEKAEADRRLKRMQRRLREEQRMLLKGEDAGELGPMFGADDDDDSSSADEVSGEEIHRMNANQSGHRPTSRRGGIGNFPDEDENSMSEDSLAGRRARLSASVSPEMGEEEFESGEEFESADSDF